MNLPENLSSVCFAVRGWTDTIRAMRQMPLIFGMAISALVILQVLLDAILPSASTLSSFASYTRMIVEAAASSFLLAPLAIATHRFVVLNEMDAIYSFSFRDPRFAKFYIAELVYAGVTILPAWAMKVVVGLFENTPQGVLAAFIIIIVVVIIIGLRALILFPAIAVDAPGALWRNALADSGGHTWSIFFAVLLASLPAVPTTIVYNYLTPDRHSLGHYVLTILSCAEQAIFLAAMAAVASHFFLAFAQRLRAA